MALLKKEENLYIIVQHFPRLMDLLFVCNYWTYCIYIVERQKKSICIVVKWKDPRQWLEVIHTFPASTWALVRGEKVGWSGRAWEEASGSRLDKFFLIIHSLSFGQGRNTHTPVLSSETEFWISQAILLEKALDSLTTQTAKALPIPTYNTQQGAKTGLNSFWCQAVLQLQLEGISGDPNW